MTEYSPTLAAYFNRLHALATRDSSDGSVHIATADDDGTLDAWYDLIPPRQPLPIAEQQGMQVAYATRNLPELAHYIRLTMGADNQDVTTQLIDEVPRVINNLAMTSYHATSMIEPTNILFYLHGGALIGGKRAVTANFTKYLAQELGPEWLVVNIDYPLLPETTLTTLLATLEHEIKTITGANQYQHVVLGGDSSGGYLAAQLATLLPAVVTQTVLLYPQLTLHAEKYGPQLTDFRLTSSDADLMQGMLTSMAQLLQLQQNLIQTESLLDQVEFSPLENSALLPPTLLISAEVDALTLQAQVLWRDLDQRDIGDRYIVFNQLKHAFIDLFGVIPQAQRAAEEIVTWLKTI